MTDTAEELDMLEVESSVNPDEIKALAAESKPKKVRKPRKKAPKSGVEKLKSQEGVQTKGDVDENEFKATLEAADHTFDTEARQQAFEQNYGLPVLNGKATITMDDKAQFLLAIMDGVPYHMHIMLGMPGVGETVVRQLTPYEEDLVFDAIRMYMQKNGQLEPALAASYMQQFRMTMQVTRFNSRDLDYLKFEYGTGTRTEHATKLAEHSMRVMGNCNAARYHAMIQAAMIFNYKLKVMTEHMRDNVFWGPVSMA